MFEPLVLEGYEWVKPYDPTDFEVFLAFDGTRRGDGWRPVKVRRVRADQGQAFVASDFPWLGAHALVMRPRALDALHDVLEAHGEILPLTTDDGVSLWVFNVTCIRDALDTERSAVVRFPGTDKIMRITSPVFRGSAVHGVDVFRLPHRASPTYVSQRFVSMVKDARLVGFGFKPVPLS
jgi:hypothetical protein